MRWGPSAYTLVLLACGVGCYDGTGGAYDPDDVNVPAPPDGVMGPVIGGPGGSIAPPPPPSSEPVLVECTVGTTQTCIVSSSFVGNCTFGVRTCSTLGTWGGCLCPDPTDDAGTDDDAGP